MNFTPEMIAAAKTADSPAALIAIAKDHGITLSDSEAVRYFRQLAPATGELTDDELDAVSGGGCGGSSKPAAAPTLYGLNKVGGTKVKYKEMCPECRQVRIVKGVWDYGTKNYNYWFEWTDIGAEKWRLQCSQYHMMENAAFTGDPTQKGVEIQGW